MTVFLIVVLIIILLKLHDVKSKNADLLIFSED